MEKLKEKTNKAILEVVNAFAKKQGYDFEDFVADDIFGVAFFGDVLYFNISDIYYDLITKQPKGLIVTWLDDSLANQQKKINYQSYSRGLRFEHLKEKL